MALWWLSALHELRLLQVVLTVTVGARVVQKFQQLMLFTATHLHNIKNLASSSTSDQTFLGTKVNSVKLSWCQHEKISSIHRYCRDVNCRKACVTILTQSINSHCTFHECVSTLASSDQCDLTHSSQPCVHHILFSATLWLIGTMYVKMAVPLAHHCGVALDMYDRR